MSKYNDLIMLVINVIGWMYAFLMAATAEPWVWVLAFVIAINMGYFFAKTRKS